jgi:hypothetical protein
MPRHCARHYRGSGPGNAGALYLPGFGQSLGRLELALGRDARARGHKMASLPVKTTKSPHLHPSLKRRVGDAAEAALLVGAFAVIWGSIGVVVIAALFR